MNQGIAREKTDKTSRNRQRKTDKICVSRSMVEGGQGLQELCFGVFFSRECQAFCPFCHGEPLEMESLEREKYIAYKGFPRGARGWPQN